MRETFRPIQCSEPYAILCGRLGAHLIRPIGRLDFVVPSGVTRFGVVITGAEPGETVKAAIRNAAGEVVAERDNIAAPHAFVLEREDHAAREVWSIALGRASKEVLEDVTIQTIGIPQLLSAGAGDRQP